MPPVKVKRGRKKVDLEMVERDEGGEETDVKQDEGKRKKNRRKERKGVEDEEQTQTWVEEEKAEKVEKKRRLTSLPPQSKSNPFL